MDSKANGVDRDVMGAHGPARPYTRTSLAPVEPPSHPATGEAGDALDRLTPAVAERPLARVRSADGHMWDLQPTVARAGAR